MANKRGKRYLDAFKKIDREKMYAPMEALEMVKELASAKFDESIEVAVKLGIDPKHADQQVRGAVVLPHGTGKDVKVIVFAQGEKAKEAEVAGAEHVGAEELATKIEKEGWLDFDVAIATPDMMRVVGRLGRILGPRGLMPNPKIGTVTFDVSKAVEEAKAGKVEYRADRTSIVHVPLGRVSFSLEKLFGNFKTVLEVLIKARPASAKGRYLRSIFISSTMGPAVKIDSSLVVNMEATE